MREILFRGKDPESGEWHYGYYVKRNDGDRGDLILEDYYLESYEIVKHETVGQYTGLTDKNGVKIFEGDILSASKRNGVVVWHDDCGGYCVKHGFNGRSIGLVMNDFDVEVIGNIHDNPELMEGK